MANVNSVSLTPKGFLQTNVKSNNTTTFEVLTETKNLGTEDNRTTYGAIIALVASQSDALNFRDKLNALIAKNNVRVKFFYPNNEKYGYATIMADSTNAYSGAYPDATHDSISECHIEIMPANEFDESLSAEYFAFVFMYLS